MILDYDRFVKLPGIWVCLKVGNTEYETCACLSGTVAIPVGRVDVAMPTYIENLEAWKWNSIHMGMDQYLLIPFSGMNIHLPAILMFTRGTRFWHTAIYIYTHIYIYIHIYIHIYIYIYTYIYIIYEILDKRFYLFGDPYDPIFHHPGIWGTARMTFPSVDSRSARLSQVIPDWHSTIFIPQPWSLIGGNSLVPHWIGG